MAKIENVAEQVKRSIDKWDDKSPTMFGHLDRFEYLEMILAEVVGRWYLKTKEIIKDRGEHNLGWKSGMLKKHVMDYSDRMRDTSPKEQTDIAMANIIYQAGKLYEYAKAIHRRKKVC